MDEIKHFFSVYKALEGKPTSVDVVRDNIEAERIIKESLEKYHREIEPKNIAERKARGY